MRKEALDFREPTLREFAEPWIDARLANRLAGKSDFAADSFASVLRQHIIPEFGDARISEISRQWVARWHMSQRDIISSRTGRPLAPRTMRTHLAVLAIVLEDAIFEYEGFLPEGFRNPARLPRRVVAKRVDRDSFDRARKVFEPEEIRMMISDQRLKPERRMLWALSFFLGARPGEIVALKWADIEHDDPLAAMRIRRSIRATIVRNATKTGSHRRCPIHPTLAGMLRGWREEGFENRFKLRPEPDHPIVPGRGAPRRIRHSCVNATNVRLVHDLKKLGLRAGRTPHDWRASFLTIAEACGARRDVISRATHPRGSTVLDGYVRQSWSELCQAVLMIEI